MGNPSTAFACVHSHATALAPAHMDRSADQHDNPKLVGVGICSVCLSPAPISLPTHCGRMCSWQRLAETRQRMAAAASGQVCRLRQDGTYLPHLVWVDATVCVRACKKKSGWTVLTHLRSFGRPFNCALLHLLPRLPPLPPPPNRHHACPPPFFLRSTPLSSQPAGRVGRL